MASHFLPLLILPWATISFTIMADDGYNEFLSLLAAAPSKDDAKNVVETSAKTIRGSVLAKKQEVTSSSDVEKPKDDRPKVDRLSSVTTLRHGEPQQESVEKDRVSGVKFHVEPQANQHDVTITESSYNSGDKLGSFVHMTDSDYNDAPTV